MVISLNGWYQWNRLKILHKNFEFLDKSESGKVVFFFHTKFLKVSVVITPFKYHHRDGLEILHGYSHLGYIRYDPSSLEAFKGRSGVMAAQGTPKPL